MRPATYIVLGILACTAWASQVRAHASPEPVTLEATIASADVDGAVPEGRLPVDPEPAEESEPEQELELDDFLLPGLDAAGGTLRGPEASFVRGPAERGPRGVLDSLDRPPRR